MKDATHPSNRVRQARRAAGLTQNELAEAVGVNRSSVAQWESSQGSHASVEHLARIAIATGVHFEWLATGRGRMKFESDLVPGPETPALLLEWAAQGETEVRVLAGLRKLDSRQVALLADLIDGLAGVGSPKRRRVAPYSR